MSRKTIVIVALVASGGIVLFSWHSPVVRQHFGWCPASSVANPGSCDADDSGKDVDRSSRPSGLDEHVTSDEYRRQSRDTDGDGLLDVDDNCPLLFNPAQADADADGFGDPCDK